MAKLLHVTASRRGGVKRQKLMTDEQRRALASKASRARWDRVKAQGRTDIQPSLEAQEKTA